MASKKSANQELDDMFAQIEGGDGDTPQKTGKANASTAAEAEEDVFADLKSQLNVPSRSSTPHIASSTASAPKFTPTSSQSGRSSEEKATSGTNLEAEQKTPRAPPTSAPASQRNTEESTNKAGGWWGGLSGLSSFASSAVKQAQGAVEQLQKNEEAQKWVEQARGNVGILKGLGDDLRSKALPTFTNILHTLAPPISAHERLQIHITHDIVGYPALDPLIYQSFSRVMAQVEGGELLVIQRGSESMQRRPSEIGYSGSGGSGWSEGSWWKVNDAKRNLSAVEGLPEGTKLARVNAEAYSHDFYSSRGGLEEAMKQATAVITESNPTRTSDIFVAIQPISHTASTELFAASKEGGAQTEGEKIVKDESQKPDQLISFAIYLHDPVHTITYSAISQPLPRQWIDWMAAESTGSVHDGTKFVPTLPEEIQDIIASGGVDPREWVAEWLEESLSLATGVVAQRYVARRMGVGEGGIGRGKRREEPVESGGGEAARAI